MMILDVGDMSQRVHEAHGPIEVLELELPANDGGLLREDPAGGQFGEQALRLGRAQGRYTPFAGLAAFGGEVTHAVTLLRENLRAT